MQPGSGSGPSSPESEKHQYTIVDGKLQFPTDETAIEFDSGETFIEFDGKEFRYERSLEPHAPLLPYRSLLYRSDDGKKFVVKIAIPAQVDVSDVSMAMEDEQELLLRLTNLHKNRCDGPHYEVRDWSFFPEWIGYNQEVPLKLDDRGLGKLPVLFRRFLNGKELVDWCNDYAKASGKFSGVKTAKEWFQIAERLAESLVSCHQQRVIHGNLHPGNIIVPPTNDAVCPDSLSFINFGFRWLDHKWPTRAHETRGGWFPHFCYDAPEVVRERAMHAHKADARPVFAAADIYSLGMVLLYLAAGDRRFPSPFCCTAPIPPDDARGSAVWELVHPVAIRSRDDYRDDIRQLIRDENKGLYDENPGIADLISFCTRPDYKERTLTASAVIRNLRVFREMGKPVSAPGGTCGAGVVRRPENVRPKIEPPAALKPTGEKNELVFDSIKADLASRLDSYCEDLDKRQLYECIGGREHLLLTLMNALVPLSAPDLEYQHYLFAVTTPVFWKAENIGTRGRFLVFLKSLAKEVAIRWLLVFDPERRDDPGTREVFEKLKKELELRTDGQVGSGNGGADPPKSPEELREKPFSPGLYLGYLEFATPRMREFRLRKRTGLMTGRVLREQSRSNRAEAEKIATCGRLQHDVLIAPDFRVSEGQLVALRFWQNPSRDELKPIRFLELLWQSLPVDGYPD